MRICAKDKKGILGTTNCISIELATSRAVTVPMERESDIIKKKPTQVNLPEVTRDNGSFVGMDMFINGKIKNKNGEKLDLEKVNESVVNFNTTNKFGESRYDVNNETEKFMNLNFCYDGLTPHYAMIVAISPALIIGGHDIIARNSLVQFYTTENSEIVNGEVISLQYSFTTILQKSSLQPPDIMSHPSEPRLAVKKSDVCNVCCILTTATSRHTFGLGYSYNKLFSTLFTV